MGLITVKLHNRYHNIQLPQVLGFFGGSRFVPIVTAFSAILLDWFSSSFGQPSNNGSFRQVKASPLWEALEHSYMVF